MEYICTNVLDRLLYVHMILKVISENLSLCYHLTQFFNLFLPYRADGGVSNNSFIMQMTSDLINKKIDKPVNTDASGLGAAFLAGLALGKYTCSFPSRYLFSRVFFPS